MLRGSEGLFVGLRPIRRLSKRRRHTKTVLPKRAHGNEEEAFENQAAASCYKTSSKFIAVSATERTSTAFAAGGVLVSPGAEGSSDI